MFKLNIVCLLWVSVGQQGFVNQGEYIQIEFRVFSFSLLGWEGFKCEVKQKFFKMLFCVNEFKFKQLYMLLEVEFRGV